MASGLSTWSPGGRGEETGGVAEEGDRPQGSLSAKGRGTGTRTGCGRSREVVTGAGHWPWKRGPPVCHLGRWCQSSWALISQQRGGGAGWEYTLVCSVGPTLQAAPGGVLGERETGTKNGPATSRAWGWEGQHVPGHTVTGPWTGSQGLGGDPVGWGILGTQAFSHVHLKKLL